MPLPNDPELVKVAHELVNELQAIWEKHPGFRTSAFAGEPHPTTGVERVCSRLQMRICERSLAAFLLASGLFLLGGLGIPGHTLCMHHSSISNPEWQLSPCKRCTYINHHSHQAWAYTLNTKLCSDKTDINLLALLSYGTCKVVPRTIAL